MFPYTDMILQETMVEVAREIHQVGERISGRGVWDIKGKKPPTVKS